MKTILYLGTDPSQFISRRSDSRLIHFPVIKVVQRSLDNPDLKLAYEDLDQYTHLIFTSKNAVNVFFEHLSGLMKTSENLKLKTIVAIGTVTAEHLSYHGLFPQYIAHEETQEGIVQLLCQMDLKQAYFFLPRSSRSRPILTHFLKENRFRYRICDLYDTVAQIPGPKPDLKLIDEIVFTSPSTVEAFLEIFGALPKNKKLTAIGPITERALDSKIVYY